MSAVFREDSRLPFQLSSSQLALQGLVGEESTRLPPLACSLLQSRTYLLRFLSRNIVHCKVYVPIILPDLALPHVRAPRFVMLAADTNLQDPFQIFVKPLSAGTRSLGWTLKCLAICTSAEGLQCRCSRKIFSLFHPAGKFTSSSLTRKI